MDALDIKMPASCYYESVLSYYNYNSTEIHERAIQGTLSEPLDKLSGSTLSGMFSGRRFEDGKLVYARGHSMKYYVTSHEDLTDTVNDWEQEFVDFCGEFSDDHTEYSMAYFANRSITDEVTAAVMSDVYLYAIGIVMMIIYLSVSVGKKSLSQSRVGLALYAIFLILYAVAASFGLCFALGISMVSITFFLVLLLVGVGVDSVFLIVNTMDRTDPALDLPTRLGKVMAEVSYYRMKCVDK